jgi:GTPase involved in cell partitioning and DNA repair
MGEGLGNKFRRDLEEVRKEVETSLRDKIPEEFVEELRGEVETYVRNVKGRLIRQYVYEILNEVKYEELARDSMNRLADKIKQELPKMVIEKLRERGYAISDEKLKEGLRAFEEYVEENLDKWMAEEKQIMIELAKALKSQVREWIIDDIEELLEELRKELRKER